MCFVLCIQFLLFLALAASKQWPGGLAAHSASTLQRKSHLYIHFLGIARPQSQCVCERFICTFPGLVHIFPAAEKADRSWKCINLSQIYKCRNWETGHYNSVLEITVSFLGIHKWEPDIYFGFPSALHLQCTGWQR
jgi:hypothetical protein